MNTLKYNMFLNIVLKIILYNKCSVYNNITWLIIEHYVSTALSIQYYDFIEIKIYN